MSPFVILDESAIKRLKRAVGTECELVVGVGDWLSHLNLFSDAQVYDILKFIRERVESFDEAVAIDLAHPPTMLAVCDSRWVSFTGAETFWDTETSEVTESLGEFALTHIMCDVGVLRARMDYRRGRFNEDQKQTAAGSTGSA
jgi:hypothetical protein